MTTDHADKSDLLKPKFPFKLLAHGFAIIVACLSAYAFAVNYDVKIVKIGERKCPEVVRQLGPGLQWPWLRP